MKHLVFLKRIFLLLILFILLDFLISVVLLNGLNRFYGINQKPDVLINGSSTALSAFNRITIEHLTKMKIANYSHEGVSIEDRLVMIEQFFHDNPESVKTVVYEVNPVLFSGTRTAANVYTIFYPYLDNKSVDKYVKERASNIEYYINKLIRSKRFESRLTRYALFGYLNKYEVIKTVKLDTTNLKPLIDQRGKLSVKMDSSKIKIFEDTMDLIQSYKANIIIVMMPMYYIKSQTFDNKELEKMYKYFETLSLSNKNIRFLNLNRDSMIYNAGYFSDLLHYNVYGQQKITNMIISHLIEN